MEPQRTKVNGRTWPDLISENSTIVIIILSVILIAALTLVSLKVPIRIGSFEIGAKPVVVHDTVTIRDTIPGKTVYVTKPNETIKTNVKSEHQSGGQTAGEINNNFH